MSVQGNLGRGEVRGSMWNGNGRERVTTLEYSIICHQQRMRKQTGDLLRIHIWPHPPGDFIFNSSSA